LTAGGATIVAAGAVLVGDEAEADGAAGEGTGCGRI
jgi:hypothetical protein